MVNDDKVAGNRVSFVKHIFVHTFDVVYIHRKGGNITHRIKKKQTHQSPHLSPYLRHLLGFRFGDFFSLSFDLISNSCAKKSKTLMYDTEFEHPTTASVYHCIYSVNDTVSLTLYDAGSYNYGFDTLVIYFLLFKSLLSLNDYSIGY